MDSQKIPVSPALRRLFEEFKSMDGERHEARGEAKMPLKVLAARGLSVDEDARALASSDARTPRCSTVGRSAL